MKRETGDGMRETNDRGLATGDWGKSERQKKRVIPSGAAKRRRRGIAVVPIEGLSFRAQRGIAIVPTEGRAPLPEGLRFLAWRLGMTIGLGMTCVLAFACNRGESAQRSSEKTIAAASSASRTAQAADN